MKIVQTKYDKIVVAIIALSLFAILFGLIAGIIGLTETYTESYTYPVYNYFGDVLRYETRTYIRDDYESGALAISGTVLMFVSLIPSALTLFIKSNKKHFIMIPPIILCLACFFLFLFAAMFAFNGESVVALSSLSTALSIIILVLSCTYLGLCESKRAKAVKIEKEKLENHISLEQGAKELKNLKELFDIGVFSEQEYTLQKNKIFGAMGVERNTPKPVQSATQSTVAIPQTPTETIEQPSMKQIKPDGNYDVGAMILSLSGRTFTITKKDTNATCSTGTFTYDNDGNVLTLFTADGTKMQLSIDQNGNLVTARGTTYRKI